MNKNLFKTFAIAAMTVLAGACAKENEQLAGPSNVTFEIDNPVAVTKAIGDGKTAKQLYYQVFDAAGNPIAGLPVQKKTLSSLKTTVSFQLIKDQTYNFIFWAQTPEDGYYTIDGAEGLKKITANYEGKKSNDENFDAFYAVEKALTINGPITKTVTLKRPFAQINIATTDVLKAGDTKDNVNYTGATSAVTVKDVPTVFSPLTDELSSPVNALQFASAAIPEGNFSVTGSTDTYKYLAVNYVFAPVDGTVYDVEAAFKVDGKDVTVKVPSAPAKRNYRTNILGNLLTSQAIFNVEIAPIFNEPDYDQMVANSESEFFAAVAKGGRVILSHDLTLKSKNLKPTKENTEIVIGDGVTLTGEYSGYTSSVISYFNAVGSQLLTGEGTIVCPSSTKADITSAIAVEDNANVITIDGNLTIKGRQGTKSKAVDAGVIIRAGKVVVNSGHFIASKDVDGQENPAILLYSPNSYRSELVINGGTFESEVGNAKFLINKQAEYVANCKISICGGTFIGFDPADNEADGPHTNYVADGYHSTKVSTDPATGISTYVVTKEGVTPVVDQAGLNSALGEASTGDCLKLPAGTYTLPKLTKSLEGVTFEGKLGADGNPLTVIDLASVAYTPSDNGRPYNDVTFKNIQFKTWPKDATYKGFRHSGNLLFEGCTFTGIHYSYGNETYKKCKFIQEEVEYNMWVYGGTIVDYIDCTFEGKGKFLHVYNEGNPQHITVNIQGCKFISTASDKPAINIKGTCGATILAYTVNIDNCTVSGAFPEINGGLWQVDKPATAENNKITVNVDGKKVYLN